MEAEALVSANVNPYRALIIDFVLENVDDIDSGET